MNIEDYQDAEKRTCVTTDPDDTIKLALTGQESGSSLAETGLHLDSDETYRLFISLHEQLKHMDTYRGDERTSKPTDSSPLAKK